ncbi:hypothetical protein BT93_H3898 [Corymbia citriodora subsp. variegata]|nr:hypothetical protein BT93_H3898 [Corymbia citriodora subsp. variegata]
MFQFGRNPTHFNASSNHLAGPIPFPICDAINSVSSRLVRSLDSPGNSPSGELPGRGGELLGPGVLPRGLRFPRCGAPRRIVRRDVARGTFSACESTDGRIGHENSGILTCIFNDFSGFIHKQDWEFGQARQFAAFQQRLEWTVASFIGRIARGEGGRGRSTSRPTARR